MKRLSIAAAVATLVAAPAVAGSLDVPPPMDPVFAPAPAPVAMSGDWGGFYAGGQLGYADVTVDPGDADDIGGYGWLGGVHAGYNWDLGNVVVGLEGDYDFTDISIGDGVGSIDNVARLKLRAGYDMGSTLLYATAGAAHANATVGGTDFSDTGWFAGLGVGYQMTDSLVLGGELLGHRFDDFDGTGLDVKATTATVRASFKF